MSAVFPPADDDARRRSAAHVFVGDVDLPVLDERDVHHLLRVLRLRTGQLISVADGTGRWRLCSLQAGRRAYPSLPALEPASAVIDHAEHRPALTVAFAPPKGERPEWALAKLTELGIDRIIPLITARSVLRWEDRRTERHRLRWEEVARQAAMQSRRLRLPVIEEPTDVVAVLASVGEGAVVAIPGGGPPSLDRPTVLIGPEGGWSDEEEAAAPATVGLGPQILRTETAAIVAASLFVALRSGLVGTGGRGEERDYRGR